MVNHATYGPGQYFAIPLSDGKIQILNVETGQLVRSIIAHTGAVSSLNYSPDGRNMTSTTSEDNTVKVWDAVTGELIHIFTSDP